MGKITLRKAFKKAPAKILNFLLLFSLIVPNVLSPAIVIAQDLDIAQEESITEIPIDETKDILEEGISTSIFEEGVYTVSLVEEKEYVYPEDDRVRIRFTSITEEGDLTIKKVILTEEEKLSLNTTDEYAWDFTSTMSNGSFTYDLTLPNTLDSENVEVKYSEDGDVYESIDNNNIVVNEDVIYIEGLDHFTVFVVVDDGDTGYSDNGWSSHPSGYNGDHKYTTSTHSGSTATWTFTGESGLYAILPSWVIWTDHATNAHYTSTSISGFELTVNQKIRANESVSSTATNGTWSGWYPNNGRYNLENGKQVTLSVETGTTNGNLVADAMAFVSMKEIYVDNDWSSKTIGEDLGDGKIYKINAFSTIQEGINAVEEGGTVYVTAGSYIVPAGIVINKKNLTLRAVGEVIVKYSDEETVESPYGLIGISVLANMGTVTVDGFTVTGYENGIAQSVTKSTGTAFHVINSTVYPGYKDGGPYMRNGIQVTGIGSRVIGNTVIGAPLTESWSGTTIHVLNSNDVIVENNTITDSFYDIGIGIMNYNSAVDVKNITIRNNSITNAQEAFRISANDSTNLVSDITFENNTISGPENNNVSVYGLNIQTVAANRILFKNNDITFNSSDTKEIRISPTLTTASNIIIEGGLITGTITPNTSGYISTTLNYAGFAGGLTLVAQITGVDGNLTHFEGTIGGLINATVKGSINASGYDSLSAILTIDGIAYPVRLLGDFVQAGHTGGFTGRIVTGDYAPYAASIEIEAPKTIIEVGETLQLSVTPDIEVAWTVYVNDQAIGSVDETGLITGLQEGEFIVIAVAQDGSLLDDTIAITVDDTPPIMTNYGISDTLLNSSENSIDLTGDIIDDISPIKSVKFALWNSDKSQLFYNWTNTNATDGAYDSTNESTNHNIDISTLPEGDYVLGVRGWDMAGNKASGGDHYFTIDRTAPSIPDLLFPNDSQYLNANDLYIDWNDSNDNHTDQSNIVYQYRLYSKDPSVYPNGSYFSMLYTGTTRHPSSGFASGTGEHEYWYAVQAIDEAGNESGFGPYRRFVVDNTAPTINFELPENGRIYSGEIDLKATCNEECDYINFWWKKEGQSYSNIIGDRRYHYVYENGTSFEWTLYTLNAEMWGNDGTYVMPDGTYYFYAAGKDIAGNWARTPEIMVTVDNTAPQGSIDSLYYSSKETYVNHFITNDNTPTIRVLASDNLSGVKNITVTIDDIQLTSGGGYFPGPTAEFVANFENPIQDGEYTIKAVIEDYAGNTETLTQALTIDTVAPTAVHTYYKNGIEITNPIAYVKGTSDLTFLAEYFDEGSGIYQDSYVIFDSNEDGTARTSKAYCTWRNQGNTLLITENPLRNPSTFH